ncbi:helix-turn-helix transcriptional regulator [uncultured Sneathiella sp.]|uniref:helix-turn-helix transcriptional regulator n=1 Tax=uncultured Sneathiella sp. TaxID=879315 RepID=UPI0030ED6E39|tara:strand:- start:14623 stop:14973 length:351 start_codon:yes stop_codon:yes gene_type:complete
MLSGPSYLKAYRHRSGLTQAEVARLLGFDAPVSISRYENFQRVPHLEAALALEMLFDASVGELFPQVSEKVLTDLLQEIEALHEEIRKNALPADHYKVAALANMQARLREFCTTLM